MATSHEINLTTPHRSTPAGTVGALPSHWIAVDPQHDWRRRSASGTSGACGNQRLRPQDIHRIVDTFTRQLEIPRYSRMVPLAEIGEATNDFNLNISRYIDSSEPEDLQDIEGHLRGGIPNRDLDSMERYWEVFPSMRSHLFESAGRPGYSRLTLSVAELKGGILGHSEFKAFKVAVTALFEKWRMASARRVCSIKTGDHPKALLETLSENLLELFRPANLLDPYDVYQNFMDYWAEAMQDDVYLLVQEGWKAVIARKPNTDLIPESLIIVRYFGASAAAIGVLEADHDAITHQMEEFDEENGGEDGLGPRFLLLRFKQADRQKVGHRAIEGSSKAARIRTQLAKEVETFFHGLKIAKASVRPKHRQVVVNLADLVAVSRSPVERDRYSRDIQSAPEPEMPGRVAKQLEILARSLAVLSGRSLTNDDDLAFVRQVAFDTIPVDRRAVLLELAQVERASTTEIARSLAGFSEQTVRRALEDLEMLGVVFRRGDGNQHSWALCSQWSRRAGICSQDRRPIRNRKQLVSL